MPNNEGFPEPERVSVSLAQLRAELVGLELRLVDRLNKALVGKADEAILRAVEKRVDVSENRLTVLESTVVTGESPVLTKVDMLEQEMVNLREVGKYKKWLWAQTVALFGISVPLILFIAQHFKGDF